MLAGRHFAIGVYLIALLFWVGPSSSSAEPKVFIGSVGSGPGVSFFGHGFVAIGDSTVPEQFWIAYDYTIHRRDGQTPTVQDLTDHPEALDFKIQKAPYFMHSWNYQMSENRTLTLVGLRLTVAQIAKFQGLLENDLRAPEKVLAYKAQSSIA